MKRPLLAALALGAAVMLGALAACSTPNPHHDPAKPHHRPDGFQNLHLEFQPRGALTFLQWQWDAYRNGHPRAARLPTPVVAPDLEFLHRNARAGAGMEPAATWVGHSTVLLQFSGLNLITDPIFSERASPFTFMGPRRAQPPGLMPEQLPRIDVVLISHNHYDHLDEASVRALAAQAGGPPLFLVPLGVKRWFTDLGITQVRELDWWDAVRVPAAAGEVELIFTPVQHWSGRSLKDTRMQALWGGFAVMAPDFQLYYAGDTGYSPDFRLTRQRLAARQGERGFDLALIPIGAYEPRWFMREQHVDPPEAVAIHQDLRAVRSLGVHWGTFSLTDEALDDPPLELARARQKAGLAEDDFFVLAVGQTRRLPKRQN